jgi:NAD(P)-dependent dehydrogenase (short-subunit alcohol dehydrogenase family)
MQPFLTAAGTQDDPARNIIVSSVGGIIVPHVGQAGAIAYSASKAAAHHLTRNFAMEHIPHHITTNTIAPGWFPTRLANPAIDKAGGAEIAGASNPSGRLGVPDDIAGVAVYLASRAGRYVNGEDISVDGGSRLANAGAMHHIQEVRKQKKESKI